MIRGTGSSGALFTRTVNARVSDAFPEGAPFVNFRMEMGSSSLRLSKGKLSRTEVGDRAIEPLYPTFLCERHHGGVVGTALL